MIHVKKEIILSFFVGIIVSSLAWGSWWKYKTDQYHLWDAQTQAAYGRAVLTYINDSEQLKRLGTNSICNYDKVLKDIVGKYPYYPHKDYWNAYAEDCKLFLESTNR